MNSIELQNLIEERKQESLYLEFKRGGALGKQNNEKAELIKDVTGFANADGGLLIYGIGESKGEDGVVTADQLMPITSSEFTKEWISSVIHDNTGPRFFDFDVQEIAVDGGRVIVVDVRRAGTAHQNLLDHKYHQRAGVVTRAIQDFQIRDLMARSMRPVVEVDMKFKPLLRSDDLHRDILQVKISNTGTVTMEKWWLDIIVPSSVFRDTREDGALARSHHLFPKMVRKLVGGDDGTLVRISFGDPFFDERRYILHPGQSYQFNAGDAGFPQLVFEVDDAIYGKLEHRPPVRWTLFCNDAPPIAREIPFDTWCTYF